MTVVNPAFAAALEARKKREEEAESKKSSSGNYSADFEQVKYFGLEDTKEKVFRIVGNPAEVRKEPWEAKVVLQSQIAKEDKKSYFKCNWPWTIKDGKYIPDPDFILTKVYNKVMESKWTNYTEADLGGTAKVEFKDGKYVNGKGKNGYYKGVHANTKIYQVINANFKEGEKYPKSFYPSSRVILPVIDRHDSWCKDNKHSKLLSSKISVSSKANDDGTFNEYPDTGIPFGCYTKIMDHASSVGHWDIDYVAIKDVKEKDYTIWDIQDTKYLTDPNTKIIGIESSLTDEEKSYEHYNLDKLFSDTSANKLKKNWLAYFKLCDAELGTSFTEELELICKIEIEERAKAEAENATTSEKTEVKKEEVKVETKKEEVKVEEPKAEEARPARRSSESVSSESIFDLCVKNFPKFKDLPEDQQKILASRISSFDGTAPNYIDKADAKLLCSNEKCVYVGTTTFTGYPEAITSCPICGSK